MDSNYVQLYKSFLNRTPNYYSNSRNNHYTQNTTTANNTDKPNNNLLKTSVIGGLGLAGAIGLTLLVRKTNLFKHKNKLINYRKNPFLKFPELTKHKNEVNEIDKRIEVKKARNLLDTDYYKDIFRQNVTISAERLKTVRESSNKKLRKIFDTDRIPFTLTEGFLIHGKNEPEKKKLLQHFISEAKKAEMDVVNIKAGDKSMNEIRQDVVTLFPAAKKKFVNEKKHTLFVIEDADEILSKETFNQDQCAIQRTLLLETNNCGMEGVCWVSTAKDINTLNEASIRGGRITHKIDIDEALKNSQKQS